MIYEKIIILVYDELENINDEDVVAYLKVPLWHYTERDANPKSRCPVTQSIFKPDAI
jgi:hypothetical protein